MAGIKEQLINKRNKEKKSAPFSFMFFKSELSQKMAAIKDKSYRQINTNVYFSIDPSQACLHTFFVDIFVRS